MSRLIHSSAETIALKPNECRDQVMLASLRTGTHKGGNTFRWELQCVAWAAGLLTHLIKLWYRPNACQSAALLHPVMVTVNMLTFSLPFVTTVTLSGGVIVRGKR